MIQRRSRIPALMMLLALMAFSIGMVFARRGTAGVVQNSQLAALKAAVNKPDVKWETWLKYGQTLELAKKYDEAIVAYEQVLKTDPYQTDARWHCALCLGSALKDTETFFKFMRDTIPVDP